MEKNHSFLFPKKNLMKIFFLDFWIFFFFWKFLEILNFLKELKFLIDDFFFLKNLEILNFFKELKILIDVFFFKQPKKYEPNAPSPKAFFENFLLFLERFRKDLFYFFFLKYEDLFIIKKWRRWRWRWSKSDEDLFMMIFFFFLKNLSFEWE